MLFTKLLIKISIGGSTEVGKKIYPKSLLSQKENSGLMTTCICAELYAQNQQYHFSCILKTIFSQAVGKPEGFFLFFLCFHDTFS